MNQFDIAQSCIEQCRIGMPADDLAMSFQRATEALGFRYFACCSHVDPLRPPRRAIVLHNYPRQWAHTFSELRIFDIDPVFHYASRSSLPFSWDMDAFRRDLTPPQQEILAEGARLGIAHGYTVPIHSPRSMGGFQASCSVVPDSFLLDAANYSAVQLMAFYIYEAARAAAPEDAAPAIAEPGLSRRERQCLELAAQGKSDWAVGKILSIAECTVHNHIENAKRRFGVATRVQAIVIALAARQISFGDVIRAEPRGRPHWPGTRTPNRSP